ncbi:GntR family transcriptional regulator [Saccharopolyspora sp. ASAGF58]|uniref:GntR family transcriptional regulator n=1 Tax=Saccharopolyspora TaxID=1835 RepID=UPI001FF0B7AB|nr:GntR family transcriptional regulator [Saccharopolyspora sp. ASAGF58]
MPKRDRSVMDQAHKELKRKIVTLQARPGERLDDISLAEELGLSRTPVREALFRLSSEGLVNVGPKGGFTVRPLDLVDIAELFEAHIVVARATARLLAARATEGSIEELARANTEVNEAIKAGSPAAISAANAHLHRLEALHARNEHLRSLAWPIHDQGQRLAYLSFGGDAGLAADLVSHFKRTCKDHEEMLAAVRDHDADAAEQIAARHVHLFRDRVVEFLQTRTVDGIELAGELPATPLVPHDS